MAGMESGGSRKKRAVRYNCCTPMKQCTGQLTGDGGKTHSCTDEVHKCQGNYLVSIGYVKLNKREYKSPEGPILILNKKATRSKGGKADRFMRGNRMAQKVKCW